MAENNNDDLSMEEILSSIKNILSEDSSTPPLQENKASVEEKSVVAASATEPEEDILDLSPEMRVEDAPTFDTLNAEVKTPDAESFPKEPEVRLPENPILDDKDPVVTMPADENTTIDVFDEKSDPFFEEALSPSEPLKKDEEIKTPQEDDIINFEDINTNIAEVLNSVDEQVKLSTPPQETLNQTTNPIKESQVQPVEAPVALEENSQTAKDSTATIEEEIDINTLPTLEDVTPNIFAQEENALNIPETTPLPAESTLPKDEAPIDIMLDHEILPAVEDVEALTPQAETSKDQPSEEKNNTLDVSASLINNFAKMFSKSEDKKEPEQKVEDRPLDNEAFYSLDTVQTVAPTKEDTDALSRQIGNGTQTISDLIKDVIHEIIGKEVERRWNLSLDYDEIVRQELKNWMDKNLPDMVEDMVKKEIRRVMVKVGDN